MINTVIVELGGIGNRHADCYSTNQKTQLVAACDQIKKRADKAAKKHNCEAYYNVESLLSSGLEINAASICTAGVENGSHHYKPTMELLNAGIPVLGEKPISNDIGESKEMVALAKAKNIPYAIDHNHRFTPAVRNAKEWLDEGRLGELNSINMRMWINNNNESSEHFHIRALHPHSFDMMRFFCGEVSQVHAFFKKGAGRAIWSNVQVNLLYENGVIGHLLGSYDGGGPGTPWGVGNLRDCRPGGAHHNRGSVRGIEIPTAPQLRKRNLLSSGRHERFQRNIPKPHRPMDRGPVKQRFS